MNSNSIENEYNEIEKRNGWSNVYQEIREKSEIWARQNDFSIDESRKMNNRRFNRYRDVSPYDHSRIVLKRGEVDYINANLVKFEPAERKYILCQGPLPGTVGHFWLMVWENNSRAILMLNKLIEKKQTKCHLYWPETMGEDHKLELPDVQLSIIYTECQEYKNFSKRKFRLTDTETNKSREIIQFHYTTWPDFGVPSSPVAFLQFLKQVRDSGALDKDVGPPIIHCSAGIGRSGTFCLVDCCLVLIDKEGENKVNVQEVLLELRRYRMGLIQTVDQLFFSYQAIIEGMKRMNNSSLDECEEISSPQNQSDAEVDETPPPLPPPRHDSLPRPAHRTVIPTSDSSNEDYMNNLVERNNQMNEEKTKQYRENNMNRPLPPLPKESLDKVNEADISLADNTDSSGEDELIDSDDNESEENANSDYEDGESIDNENGRGINANEQEKSHFNYEVNMSKTEALNADGSFDANANLPPIPNADDGNLDSLSTVTTTTSTTTTSSSTLTAASSDTNISSPESETSPSADLRRRKRQERTQAMEEKIREIKRKQREVENKTSPKKRRSILISIAAGVCLGIFCVYFYTRNI